MYGNQEVRMENVGNLTIQLNRRLIEDTQRYAE